MENLNQNNGGERFPLICNGKSFGGKYQIDTEGKLFDVITSGELKWEREVAADLSLSKKDRQETAGKCLYSRLTADDGSIRMVNRAQAIACSVPSIASGYKDGLVLIYRDGDKSNETAANLYWDVPQVKVSKERKKRAATGGMRANTLVSDDEARDILANFIPKHPIYGSKAFSERLGVAQTTVNNITSNKTHRHINRAEYASNPHISQTDYYETYRPSPKAKKYAEYKALGKPVSEMRVPKAKKGKKQSVQDITATQPDGQ